MSDPYNLDVSMYSLKEVLHLFDIDNYNVSDIQIKKAKRKTLMMHPDKSRLPKEYFLFYKKAFDIVLNFYNEQNKQNQVVEDKAYSPFDNNNEETEKIKEHINNTNSNKTKSQKFQREFNKLFEDNMMKKDDAEKNQWFRDDATQYEINNCVNASNIGQTFRQMKVNNQDIVVHKDVQSTTHSLGTDLYENEDASSYCSSNIFDKLKFDDLRKVHKDQTIMNVCESDFSKMETFGSVEHYNRHRNSQPIVHMSEEQSRKQLHQKYENHKQTMLNKEHKSNIQTMDYVEKTKHVMGSLFLHIEN